MLVTNNPELAGRARLLREYGWAERNVSTVAGWNSRLDELQAAILRVKLRHLDADNAARRRLADFYTGALSAAKIIGPHARKRSTWSTRSSRTSAWRRRERALEAPRQAGRAAGAGRLRSIVRPSPL